MNSLSSFDVRAVQSGHYYRVPARDIFVAYIRAHRSYRCSIVDALIRNRVIVASIEENRFPSNWSIPKKHRANVQHFNHPLIAVQPQPFEPGIVYVYTDASFDKLTGLSGLGYVIVHNKVIVDEGHQSGSKGQTSHIAELEGINAGIHAVNAYLASMSVEQRKNVKGICMRNDSSSALSHSLGSAVLHKSDTATISILWDTYQMMGCFDVFYYQHIPRELNAAADLLADYAYQLQLDSRFHFDLPVYQRHCEDMIDRKVCVGLKVGNKGKSIVS